MGMRWALGTIISWGSEGGSSLPLPTVIPGGPYNIVYGLMACQHEAAAPPAMPCPPTPEDLTTLR